MKKLSHIFFAVLLIAASIVPIIPKEAFASANDFYFKDFTADYYLKKQKDNSSEMEVVEHLTAVFPDYNQNHGIERKIPFLNQNDTNLTTESAEHLSVSVTRNGESEPYRVVAYDNYFLIRIGDADKYVHGENTYVIKYKFVHAITEFKTSGYYTSPYQELYWDSNGTGWSQSFDSVTVNLHMEDGIKNTVLKGRNFSSSPSYKNKSTISETNKTAEQLAAWCYVGTHGSSNQSRCEITDLADGIQYKAGRLSSRENLTFVVNFQDGTFNVPKSDFVKVEYIDKIDADYYLSKDENGKAVLIAKEKITATFPTKNTSSLFSRKISFVNKSGYVFTTDSQDGIDVDVTMDGKEPVSASTYAEDDGTFSIVVTNNDRYLHGTHTFTFEYKLKNLVLEKDNIQRFDFTPFPGFYYEIKDFKANLHIDENLRENITKSRIGQKIEEDEADCDDGYDIASRKICKVEESSDGYTFSVAELKYRKGFGIKVYFKDGTFVIPEPNRNYLCWHLFTATIIFSVIFITVICRRTFKKAGEKIKHLKNLPIVPEYTPHRDYTVGELAENYLGTTKNSKVATLLELVVAKKIMLRKTKKSEHSKKYNWFIVTLSDEGLSKEQKDLIKIINNGKDFSIGQEIEIKHHSYTSSLERAFDDYGVHIKKSLKEKGLREDSAKNLSVKAERKISTAKAVIKTIGIFFAFNLIVIFATAGFIGIKEDYMSYTGFTSYSIYEGNYLIPFILLILVADFLFWPIISSMTKKYKEHTLKGIEMSRYMDGLKLYIKMAEADRIKFLQSVEGADTSEEGIVKLYEKLLPYAALFGLEKSWMKELERYYEISNIEAPDWYDTGFNFATFAAVNSAIHSATSRPIDTSSSSGGWSSSGFSSSSSGGGGGGFSGGGGGGGGGGGW